MGKLYHHINNQHKLTALFFACKIFLRFEQSTAKNLFVYFGQLSASIDIPVSACGLKFSQCFLDPMRRFEQDRRDITFCYALKHGLSALFVRRKPKEHELRQVDIAGRDDRRKRRRARYCDNSISKTRLLDLFYNIISGIRYARLA